MVDDMPWWLGNQWFFFIFVLFCVCMALIVGRKFRGRAEAWKTVETSATLLGGVSILLLSFNVEYVFSAHYFDNNRARHYGASIALINHAQFVVRYACDSKFEKSEYSPKNFDEMISDQIVVCAWAKDIKDKMDRVNFQELDPIDALMVLPPAQKTHRWQDEISGFAKWLAYYTQYRDQMQNLKSRSQPGEFRLILLLLAPYMLGIAFALQLSKVRYKDAAKGGEEN